MRAERQYRSLLKTLVVYETLLAQLSEEDFSQSPPNGGWSYSETYSHIFQSDLVSLIAAEKCILGTGTHNRSSIHWLAWIILLIGRFPPVKIKAPERIAAMTTKISREDARNMMRKFKNRLAEIRPKIKNADPYQKVRHPRLGFLNAKQWFGFIEIHTIHHTGQLMRIKAKLKEA